MFILHVAHGLPNTSQTSVAALRRTGVSPSDSLIKWHEVTCEAGSSAPGVIMCMHFINEKPCVRKVLRLPNKTVRRKLASEIIYDEIRGDSEVSVDGGEYVIAAFCDWDSMKAETDSVGAPKDENAACKLVA